MAPLPVYRVVRAQSEVVSRWDSPGWVGVPALEIASYKWQEAGWKPKTFAKLKYGREALHCIFHVRDRYVRSVQTQYGGSVCKDACVELFFSPQPKGKPGYFNIEVNCGGVALVAWQTARSENERSIPESDGKKLEIAHTMPRTVDPEITVDTTWEISYRVPYAMIEKYSQVVRPAPGVRWRANLYKCADSSSHPHYGSWSPIDWPRPDFHRPEFFGTFEFV